MINWKILLAKAIRKSAVLVIYPTNWDSRDAQQLTWNVRALLLFLGHKTIFVMSFTVMAMVLARQIWLTFMLFHSDKLHRLNIPLGFLRRIHTAMKCSFSCLSGKTLLQAIISICRCNNFCQSRLLPKPPNYSFWWLQQYALLIFELELTLQSWSAFFWKNVQW